VPAVAQVRNVRPGYTVIHPNRDKVSCKVTRLVVILILIASAVIMIGLTVGGWSKLQGMKPLNFIWALAYVLLAVYIGLRWARGLLPIAALLGILLLIVVIIAATGADGTDWFNRNAHGFASAQSLFSGSGFSNDTLGFLTDLLIPVQLALIVFAMIGFSQGWNVEMEVPEDEARKRGSKSIASGPQAQAA
jgi:amino acid transporter